MLIDYVLSVKRLDRNILQLKQIIYQSMTKNFVKKNFNVQLGT